MTDAVIDTNTPAAAPAAAPAASPAPAPSGVLDALGQPVAAPAAAPASAPVNVPGKDAKPEDWAKFYDAVGAPKTADGYELPVPEGQDGAFAKTAAGWMADARLTPDQAKSLATKWNEHVAGMTTAQAAKAQETATAAQVAKDAAVKRDEAALANEWGTEAEKNKGVAARAYKEFFTPFAGEKLPEMVTAIENSIGFAATMKLMHAIGSKLGEAAPRGLGDDDKPAPRTGAMEAAITAEINKSLGR